MIISLIAAVAQNRIIGKGGELPWNLPADLRRFRRITMGKPVIMGRKTFESIGRPLDGRVNIILTKNRAYQADECKVVHSVEEAIRTAECDDSEEVMVIGGATLYEQFLPRAHRMYLTLIEQEAEGDTCFPRYDSSEWLEASRESIEGGVGGGPTIHFILYERKTSRSN